MPLAIEVWLMWKHLLLVPRTGGHDRGEGVISAAIAVLVMAGIGALMWVGFKALWVDAEANTRDKVAEIGR
jgi:hypothetical protein